jgi:hypothetical protein
MAGLRDKYTIITYSGNSGNQSGKAKKTPKKP